MSVGVPSDGTVTSAKMTAGAALANIGAGGMDASYLNANSQYMGFKNRIINGAMVIDQRNAGASITPIDAQYSVDRWKFNLSQSSKFTAQQSSTAPAGFTNSLLVTSSSAYAVASGDYFLAEQDIEGLNCYDLAWGTASAKSVTLSFWVYSSLTGTFGGALVNSGLNRSYPFSYTINSASTWEQKTITIAGDTSGTWLTTNGVGIRVRFGIGVGTTYSGTAGSWAATNYVSATGATSVVGTNLATFYLTGVQLEKGSTATSFDYRPYGTELQLCQRYFQTTKATGGWGVSTLSTGASTGAYILASAVLPVVMRTSPTLVWFDRSGVAGKVDALTTGASFNGTSTSVYGSSSGTLAGIAVNVNLYGTTAYGLRADYTADAEL